MYGRRTSRNVHRITVPNIVLKNKQTNKQKKEKKKIRYIESFLYPTHSSKTKKLQKNKELKNTHTHTNTNKHKNKTKHHHQQQRNNNFELKLRVNCHEILKYTSNTL